MSEEILFDQLPTSLAMCSAEIEANEIAVEYNKLNRNDPKRKELYEKWKDTRSRADWD